MMGRMRVMKSSHLYEKGIADRNEDAYTINEQEHLYAVMDGATGMEGMPGYIASQIVKDELDKSGSSIPLYERVKRANSTLNQAMVKDVSEQMEKAVSFSTIAKTKRSTTGIAAIQLDKENGFMEYVHAADCMIFIQYENGDVRALTYDVVQYLDQEVIKEVCRLRKDPSTKEITLPQYVEKVKPLLIQNR